MSLNFFTAEQNYQSYSGDVNPSLGNIKKVAFSTNGKDEVDSDKRSQFEQFMKAEKQKRNDEARQKSTEHKQDAANNGKKDVNTSSFSTKKAEVSSSLTLNGDALSEDYLAQLTALQNEIRQLLAQDGDEGTTIEVKNIADNSEDSKPEILELLSLFSAIYKADKQEDSGAELTHHGSFEEALNHVRAQLDPDLPQKILVTNLTPQEITDLSEKIEAFFNGEASEEDLKELSGISAFWVVLTPARAQVARANEQRGQNIAQEVTKLTPVSSESEISVKETKPLIAEEKHYAQSRYDARFSGEQVSEDGAQTFKSTVKESDVFAKASLPAQSLKSEGAPTLSAGDRFLQASAQFSGGTALAASDINTGFQVQSGQTSVQSSFTNVITQSQSATQPHPATQLVSATIQRAVNNGDPTNIKMRLDPPELGRVEIKMSIDKDNKTKIVLTSEKADTHAMLQRDADVLQRILSDSGVDVDNDLSFELAQDDHDFGGRGEQGQHGKGKSSNAEDDAMEISTTMDWHVDPDTGLTRYNILA